MNTAGKLLTYIVMVQEALDLSQALEASLITYAEQVAHESSPTSLAVSDFSQLTCLT